LKDLDLHAWIHLWFMHDGDRRRLLLTFSAFFNNLFPGQLVGRGGPIAWLFLPLRLVSAEISKVYSYATEVSDAQYL
jgi:hypothetical protein